MASTNYPGSLDAYPVPNNGDTISVSDHWLGPAVIGIETELGTDPAGTFTDVKSRLNDTDGKVITEIDQFELTSSTLLSTINTDVDLTANLNRVSGSGFSQKGSGMSQSSGIFTFPSTGYYLIQYNIGYVSPAASSRYSGGVIRVTEDNFSTSYTRALYTNLYTTTTYAYVTIQLVFKVDDTSTHKCKFQVHTHQAITVEANRTYMNFIRLGDV